jgi:hypothetical protein
MTSEPTNQMDATATPMSGYLNSLQNTFNSLRAMHAKQYFDGCSTKGFLQNRTKPESQLNAFAVVISIMTMQLRIMFVVCGVLLFSGNLFVGLVIRVQSGQSRRANVGQLSSKVIPIVINSQRLCGTPFVFCPIGILEEPFVFRHPAPWTEHSFWCFRDRWLVEFWSSFHFPQTTNRGHEQIVNADRQLPHQASPTLLIALR